MNSFTAESRKQYFESFWQTGQKIQQDQILMDSITKKGVNRRRTKDPNKEDKLQDKYTVHVEGEAIEVCRPTFLDLHGLTESKLRGIMKNKKHSSQNVAKPDMRGKSE